jgi:hypothetical protein
LGELIKKEANLLHKNLTNAGSRDALDKLSHKDWWRSPPGRAFFHSVFSNTCSRGFEKDGSTRRFFAEMHKSIISYAFLPGPWVNLPPQKQKT